MGIYARHDDEWYRVDEGGSAGELPGLGGWATITDVKGKGNKYSYGDWVAFEWMGTKSNTPTSGSFTNAEEGLVEVLCIGAGNANSHPSSPGNGGSLQQGVFLVGGGTHQLQAANAGLNNSWNAGISFIKDVAGGPQSSGAGGGGAGSWVTGANFNDGYFSSINGTRTEYGPSGKPNSIGGGQLVNTPNSYAGVGAVIVRVPKANYTGNLPDGAFDVPTTRQAVVAALEEKVGEAKEAVRDRRNERRKRR